MNDGCIDPLKSCLNSISKIAIALTSPEQTDGHGISIRFLNYKKDAHMNNLTCLSDIDRAIAEVPFSGITELGHQLRQKILEPFLIDPIQRKNRRLRKPLLVTIITDGDPCGEPRDELKRTILWCKKFMMDMGYGPWGKIYQNWFSCIQIADCDCYIYPSDSMLRKLEILPTRRNF